MTRGTPIQRFGAKLVLFALPLVVLISSVGAFIAWRNYREQTSQARTNLAQIAGAIQAAGYEPHIEHPEAAQSARPEGRGLVARPLGR